LVLLRINFVPHQDFMQGKALLFKLFGIFLGICFSAQLHAQCIVINEVMINPSGSNDGSNSPNTAEWVEIYNTCSTPVNIGCYSIFDGDWAATIPGGTMLGPHDYYVIGSSNSGGPVDLNIATCNCTSGQASQIGVFSNNNEQLGLLDGAGTYVDGIYWGTGQFSNSNFFISAIGACSPLTVNVGASNPIWVQASANTLGTDGSFLARNCDGSDTWQVLTSGSSIGSTNSSSAPVAAFSASSTSICAEDCITFSDESTGAPEQWEWTFNGASIPSFSGQNPPSVCYPNAGTFDVTLSISNGCGSDDLTLTGYIEASNLPQPTIGSNGALVICENQSRQLFTSAIGSLQWFVDGNIIPGATGPDIAVTETGSYTVTVSDGTCTQESEATDVLVIPPPQANISSSNGNPLCIGESTTLQVSPGALNYVWTFNGNPFGTPTNTVVANEVGNYQVIVSNEACSTISGVLNLTIAPNPTVTLSPIAGLTLCEGESASIQASGNFPTYAWRKNNALVSGSGSSLEVNEQGAYSVEVTDANGCSGLSNVVDVTLLTVQVPDLNTPPNTTICNGEELTLTLSSTFQTYAWYNAAGAIAGANTASLVVTQSGAYYVVTTDANGCEAESDPLNIAVESTPVITIDPDGNVSTCIVPFVMSAISTSGTGLWQWFESDTPIPGANASSYSAIFDGEYHVEYTSANGCFGESAPTNLTILTTFEAHILSNNDEPCEGETVVLSLDGNYTDVLWSDGSNNPELVILQGGNYTAEVTNSLGCTALADTTIAFSPLPFIDAGGELNSYCIDPVLPQVESNGTHFLWTPDFGVSNDTLMQPELNPSSSTLYTVTATLGRCVATDNLSVITDCNWIYIPNAFTPDFDGVNDAFKVVGNGIAKFEITIFNRWGDVVYFSTDLDGAWVGGEEEYFVPDGVYTYKIIALDKNGVPLLGDSETFGSILVIR
jgi:gliding motility-associated-like protein